MCRKTWLTLICICSVTFFVSGQQEKRAVLPPHIKLRISPLAAIEPDMQFMPGIEWRFNNRFSVGADIAYIFWHYGNTKNSVNSSAGSAISGFKIRPEFRYYFRQNNLISWFMAAEASYKRSVADRSEEVCISLGQAVGCSYFQRVDYREIKTAPGGALKIGLQEYFGSNRRMYFEAFLGVGFKVISKTKKDYVVPANAQSSIFLEDEYTLFEEGFAPHIPAGIKIGIRL